MRMSTDTQRTTSKGKAITPKYAARMSGAKDGSTNNIYATVDRTGTIRMLSADLMGRCPDLVQAEYDAYTEEYEETVIQTNQNYIKSGHKDRIKYKTAKDYIKEPDLCPYRLNFSIGDMDEHATLEELEKASMELIRHITDEYDHIRIISYALHADGEGGRGDVHIAFIPTADKTTRKGQVLKGESGETLKEFSINKALAQDGQEKYFKDADGIIKSVEDPDIKDPKLAENPRFCNEMVGFTQEIRQHMFDWCEKNLGLELEREPDEERSRDPYEQRQKANTRLSTKDYIELDNAKKARKKEELKVQELKQEQERLLDEQERLLDEQERLLDENDGISRQNHEASIRQREAQQQNAGPALDLSLLQ